MSRSKNPINHTNQVKNEPTVVSKSVSDDGKVIRLVMSDSPYQVYKDKEYTGRRYYHNSTGKWAKKKARKKQNNAAALKRLKRFIDHKLSKQLKSSDFDFTAHFYVYVILCSDDYYYVGTTTNVTKRFSEHKSKRGAAFTKRHRPIKIVSVDDLGVVSYRDAIIAENEKTLKIMGQHPGKATGGIAAECGWVK